MFCLAHNTPEYQQYNKDHRNQVPFIPFAVERRTPKSPRRSLYDIRFGIISSMEYFFGK